MHHHPLAAPISTIEVDGVAYVARHDVVDRLHAVADVHRAAVADPVDSYLVDLDRAGAAAVQAAADHLAARTGGVGLAYTTTGCSRPARVFLLLAAAYVMTLVAYLIGLSQ